MKTNKKSKIKWSLTSAAIKANVFKPPKNPTPTHTMNINPDKTRIVDSRATNRKCDHPGVVGENESYSKNQSNIRKNWIRKFYEILTSTKRLWIQLE